MNNQMMMRRKPRCGEKVNETEQMRPEGSSEGNMEMYIIGVIEGEWSGIKWLH